MSPKILFQGWLHARPELSDEVLGVTVPPETRTRVEEYTFVVDSLKGVLGTVVLDSATGFMPEWHRLALILARANWTVVATDIHPAVLKLQPDPLVQYIWADSKALPLETGFADVATCISTLEHLTTSDALAVVSEMLRCVRPGGKLIITADLAPWLPSFFGGSSDDTPIPEDSLCPPVYAVVVEA